MQGNKPEPAEVDFARQHLERYAAYHAHKETMAYAGLALLAAAAGAVLVAKAAAPVLLPTAASATLITVDKVLNAATGGDINHTISHRLAQGALRGDPASIELCALLDEVDPGHCAKSL